ncbi:hypothetical protein [Actinomadura graeca]|uniref:hypothetical protein n=1 Tax=Actinomadura graeca TaxID=2750812 RepID=UPI001E4F1278|nr:hypothetical protein [Actinomadura graeca]
MKSTAIEVNLAGTGRYVRAMVPLSLLRADARRVGLAGFAAPLATALLVIAAGAAARAAGQAGAGTVGLSTVRIAAMIFPIAIGFGAATVVTRERVMELQLSLPSPYWHTVLRRVGILLAASVVLAWVLIGGLCLFGAWNHPAPLLLAPLIPVGPGVTLAGVGAVGGLVLRSGGAAAVLVLLVWLAQSPAARLGADWLTGRLALVAAGTALTVAGVLLACRDTERLLGRSRQ